MRKVFFMAVLACLGYLLHAQEEEGVRHFIDSLNNSMNFQTGTIALDNGVATIETPAGFKFLNPGQSRFVLESLWGNYPDESVLGMLFPETMSPLDSMCWAFIINFDELGYVNDKDAGEIDYSDLLTEMKSDMVLASEERVRAGYESLSLVGWASPPYYDPAVKALHWAKELQFGGEPFTTLNYDIRLLGRRGVLCFRAVGGIDQLELIKPEIPKIIAGAAFNPGHQYQDFDPGLDKVAAVTIGGLVAGKVLAKAGLFAGIAKFGKFIIAGLLALIGGLVRFFKGKEKTA